MIILIAVNSIVRITKQFANEQLQQRTETKAALVGNNSVDIQTTPIQFIGILWY